METFAEKLKRMRSECAMSQAELAKKIYVSRSAIAKWEQGRGFPSVASLQFIAAEFAVTIDELVSEKEIAILEIEKDKKLSVRTKLLISISAIFGALIILGAILLGMFCPRKLSSYVNVETSEIEEISLQYWEGAEKKIVYLDSEKLNLFMFYVKNIKIVPKYIDVKMSPKHTYCVKSGNKIYEISFMDLLIRENGKLKKSIDYRFYSGNDRDLLVLFDVDLNNPHL